VPTSAEPGPFKGTRESLNTYVVPDWFRDANSESGITGGRNPPPSMAIGTRDGCMLRGSHNTNTISSTTATFEDGFRGCHQVLKADKFDADYLSAL